MPYDDVSRVFFSYRLATSLSLLISPIRLMSEQPSSHVSSPRVPWGGTVQTRGSASSNLVPPINHCGDVSGTLGDERQHGGTSTAATLQKNTRTSKGVCVCRQRLLGCLFAPLLPFNNIFGIVLVVYHTKHNLSLVQLIQKRIPSESTEMTLLQRLPLLKKPRGVCSCLHQNVP